VSYEPGLYAGPGNDDPTPSPNVTEPTVDTPDPYGTADQSSYGGPGSGPDIPIPFLPPWGITRAPGTVRTIAAGEIVPINPWEPGVALLNADQLAIINTRRAAVQAAAYYTDDPRCM
jgi:hypothetical protein